MREGIKILSAGEIKKRLAQNPGWERKGNKIVKEFAFKDFLAVLAFIIELAPFFEEKDHHPDIHIFYNKAVFDLTRYDAGEKITDLDFEVAQKVEELYKSKL